MSKAFTRESDDASAEEIAPPRPFSPSMAKRYITKEGADRLRQQAELLMEERSALLNGDSSGSADTIARVRRIEANIQKLRHTLDSVMLAQPPTDPGKTGFGAFVRIRDQQGEEETYQIVGLDETAPDQGRISASSPLAQALMNRRAGETVHFQSPAGDQTLEILGVKY